MTPVPGSASTRPALRKNSGARYFGADILRISASRAVRAAVRSASSSDLRAGCSIGLVWRRTSPRQQDFQALGRILTEPYPVRSG